MSRVKRSLQNKIKIAEYKAREEVREQSTKKKEKVIPLTDQEIAEAGRFPIKFIKSAREEEERKKDKTVYRWINTKDKQGIVYFDGSRYFGVDEMGNTISWSKEE